MRKPGSKVRRIMRSPCTSRMGEVASPPVSNCRTLTGSAPVFEAKRSPSATASMVKATMIWLATLVVCPAPFSPTRVTFLPMRSKRGLTRSNASCGRMELRCGYAGTIHVRRSGDAPPWGAHNAKPDEPIFTTVAPCPRLRSCAQIRRDPAKTGRCCGFRLVFAADPSGVAFTVERFEQEGVVDLTGAGFVATGVVRNLDVRDPVLQAAVGRQQFSIHALLVVEIELKKGVRRADFVQDGNDLFHAVEMEAWDVFRVHGLHEEADARPPELIGREAQVFDQGLPHAIRV